MKNKPLVTIGIPALNEEANIKSLLASLLDQNTSNFTLKEIIVASDGSTDNTVSVVGSVKSNKIKIIDNKIRNGLAVNQNMIFDQAKGDILILLNADVAIKDKNVLVKLVNQILSGNDLVCANLIPINPKGFFERVLFYGTIYTKRVFDSYQNGDNWATCHGAARAFSKKFYANFRFKRSVGEDMYSYFYCKFNGFNYAFVEQAIIYYKLPDSFEDHKKRSVRFMVSKAIVEGEFGKKFISDNFIWPKERFVTQGYLLFLEKPIDAVLYALVTTYMNFLTIIEGDKFKGDKWQMAISTRKVRI